MRRLVDACAKELDGHLRQLRQTERHHVKIALGEERSRYKALVNCLGPVVDEELAALSELQPIEDVMAKLGNKANKIEINDESDAESILSFATPPSTTPPSPCHSNATSSYADTMSLSGSIRMSTVSPTPSSLIDTASICSHHNNARPGSSASAVVGVS